MKKCLCYSESFENVVDLKNHYINYHGFDENSYFLKKLFTRNRNVCPRKCFGCDYFCTNRRDEKNHNFLFHYQQGVRQPIEDKPVKIVKFDENLQRFCINFNKHSDHYNFFDSRSIVSYFLTVFENNFVPRKGVVSLIECSFTIINCQPPPRVGFVNILDSRVWQTDVYSRTHFNGFVKSNLANDILRRVIINGMTGSSWRFKKEI